MYLIFKTILSDNIWWDHENTFISIWSATPNTDLVNFFQVPTKIHDSNLNFSNYLNISKMMKAKINRENIYEYIYNYIIHDKHSKSVRYMLYPYRKAVLKVMPPMLRFWSTTSEVDVGGMTAEVEPSHQYCYILLPCNRWQQRGSPTEWHLTWKCRWSKGVKMNFSMWKKRHPLTFTDTGEHLWGPNSGCEHSEAMLECYSSGDNDSRSPPLVQILTSMACRLFFIPGGNA